MLNLINFFEGENATNATNPNGWTIWVVLGLFLVLMVVMTVIPQRKQKKRNDEMMSHLAIGSTITTIGGIVGKVVKLDEQYIWIVTGTGENDTTMQFVRQAIHSIAGAEQSAEQPAESSSEDEIK